MQINLDIIGIEETINFWKQYNQCFYKQKSMA